jgi:LPS sulfotransferase NodH
MHSLLAQDTEPHALRFLDKHHCRVLLLATNAFASQLHYARREMASPPPIRFPILLVDGNEPDILTSPDAANASRVVIVADPGGEEQRLSLVRARHPGRRIVGLAGEVLPALVARAGHTIFEEAPLPPRPRRAFILFASPRSGSSLVADVMSDMGLGDVREHLRGGVLEALKSNYVFDRAAALDRFVRLSACNGVFGTKIITHFFNDFVRDGGDLDLCRAVFAGIDVAFLTLDRADKIAQSVSSEVASRRGVWHVTDDASAAAVEGRRKVDYRFASLLSRYLFYRQQTEILAVLARSRHQRLALVYEHDVETGDLYAIAERLCTSLLLDRDVRAFPRAGARKRIADTTNAELAGRFSTDMAAHFGCAG